jgi:hypothetical protein
MTGAVFRAYSRRRSNAREVSSRSAPCWLCSTHTQVASRFGVVLTQKFAAQALGGASVISRIFRRQHRGISTVRRLEISYGKDIVRAEYERLTQEH